jgi:hypothetical protein
VLLTTIVSSLLKRISPPRLCGTAWLCVVTTAADGDNSLLREPALPLQCRIFFFHTRIRYPLCKKCDWDIVDEAQKAETGSVFNKIWFMIVGGLEYLS